MKIHAQRKQRLVRRHRLMEIVQKHCQSQQKNLSKTAANLAPRIADYGKLNLIMHCILNGRALSAIHMPNRVKLQSCHGRTLSRAPDNPAETAIMSRSSGNAWSTRRHCQIYRLQVVYFITKQSGLRFTIIFHSRDSCMRVRFADLRDHQASSRFSRKQPSLLGLELGDPV